MYTHTYEIPMGETRLNMCLSSYRLCRQPDPTEYQSGFFRFVKQFDLEYDKGNGGYKMCYE